jgi:hypothetical protein
MKGTDLQGNGRVLIEVLFRHSLRGADENHEEPQSGYPGFELVTFRIKI